MYSREKKAGASSVPNGAPYISAKHAAIGFPNDTVVADINFELERGQAIALIGTNGSGKSTLLKTIVGLLPLLGGELNVFGTPPGNNHTRIAYLGQFHHSGFVLPIRAVDVVRMGRFPVHGLWKQMSKQDDEIVLTAMRIMGIEKLADSPLRSLSGGQQQRTYLAQVLAHQADLIVLDEPTSGLDAGGRELYLHAINDELCRGASIIMATHDIKEEAALCHQVMLLARRVVAIGAPDEVLTPDALLETFGIVVAGEHKLHVLECKHGHDETERQRLEKSGHQRLE
ncbi:MAG: metal ABC transporter ATP-binding protein [Dehalococcoidales bacterium]|nr:metal ABC transporter ATP-binding protein [Dehalococcoidales bacterium]